MDEEMGAAGIREDSNVIGGRCVGLRNDFSLNNVHVYCKRAWRFF